MPTKAEFKLLTKKPKLKIRKGDQVVIIAGKDKGQRGIVASVMPREQRLIIVQENPEDPNAPVPLNAVIKHQKAKYEGQKSARIKMPAPIHISNLMLIDPKTNEPTRVGRRIEKDKVVRYAKKSGQAIVDRPVVDKK